MSIPLWFGTAFALAVLGAQSPASQAQAALPGCKPKLRSEDLLPVARVEIAVTPEGKQSWVAVVQWDAKSAKRLCLANDAAKWQYIEGHIGKALADRQWCPQGWTVTNRIETAPFPLTVMGDCKSQP
jgi:hypothetical protein